MKHCFEEKKNVFSSNLSPCIQLGGNSESRGTESDAHSKIFTSFAKASLL